MTTDIMSFARGSEQRAFLSSALTPEGALPMASKLRGRAALYAGRYAASQSNLLCRVRAAGVTVIRTPGPRGGEWTAKYRIVVSEVL